MNDEAMSVSRQRSMRWWVAAAITGALVIFATIAALSLIWRSATRERDAALAWQQRSFEIMVLARTLDATIAQSEAKLGRYVVSGDQAVGRAFLDDWRRAGTLIDRLDGQVFTNPGQERIDALRTAYLVRGNELNDIALRTNYAQNAQALSKYYTAGRSESLRQITNLLDRIDRGERATLSARNARAQATIDRSNALGAVLAAFGLLLVIGMGFLAYAAVQAWRRRLTEEVRNEELEQAVATRTFELSDLNARLRAEMTTREAAEARLRQAQKMEAVGQLTGGIAHDFNNMLAVVIGGLEIAKRRLPSDSPALSQLESAMEGATRAAALTKRLLAFSRAEPVLAVAADPNGLLTDMADLLDRTLGDLIEVRVLPCAGAWPVFVDTNQFENAVLNLAVNARDAMPTGGVLTISISNTTIGDHELTGVSAGDFVRIAVVDTGSGMAEEVRDRVFEPFFTTKPLGSGTGLGLSQVFGFVRQSSGSVAIESALGEGTTVALYLPRSAELPRLARTPERALPARRSVLMGRVVLVVEDDPRVLAATTEALRELGHSPLACAAATDAEPMLAQHPETALIISDVLMPGMTGPELIQSLRRRHGAIPVLFVTGFAGDIEEAAFGGHRVLRKPFTIAALDAAINALLTPPHSRAA